MLNQPAHKTPDWASPACQCSASSVDPTWRPLPPPTHAPCRCRGDIINAPDFAEGARIPDPARLVKAYNQSAATLNLLRGFSTGKLTRLAAAPVSCASLSWHLCMQLQLAP